MWNRGLDAGHEDKRQRGMKFVDETFIQGFPNSSWTRNGRRNHNTLLTITGQVARMLSRPKLCHPIETLRVSRPTEMREVYRETKLIFVK